ncbi:MAG: hypothetical protein R3C28_25665 [Pirellulaceae bacterium]
MKERIKIFLATLGAAARYVNNSANNRPAQWPAFLVVALEAVFNAYFFVFLAVFFLAGAFLATFFLGDFLAAVFFLAGAFLATFLAVAFFLGDFLAAVFFLAGAFLAAFFAVAFFFGDFLAAVFFTDVFLVAIPMAPLNKVPGVLRDTFPSGTHTGEAAS